MSISAFVRRCTARRPLLEELTSVSLRPTETRVRRDWIAIQLYMQY